MAANNDLVDPRESHPTREWKAGPMTLVLLKGTDLAACDISGKSDPYAIIDWLDAAGNPIDANATVKTKCIDKTLNPEWKMRMYTDVEDGWLATHLRVIVMDKDLIGKDDFMGQVLLPAEKIWAIDHATKVPDHVITVPLTKRPKKKDSHVKGTLTFIAHYNSTVQGKRIEAYDAEKKIQDAAAYERYMEEREEQKKADAAKELILHPGQELIAAVLASDVAAVEKCLEAGMTPDAKSKFSESRALHMAFGRGHFEIAKLLIDAGATSTYLDSDGKDIWQLAGSDPKLRALALSTPFGLARMQANEELVLEQKAKQKEDAIYQYCLATGLTGYEDDFEERMARDAL